MRRPGGEGGEGGKTSGRAGDRVLRKGKGVRGKERQRGTLRSSSFQFQGGRRQGDIDGVVSARDGTGLG
jgi:hypothetical protein